MAEGGHDPCGQNINPSSEPIIKKNALLAEGDDVSQNFDNATVNAIAGDQTTTTVTTEKSQIQITSAQLLQIDRQIPKAGDEDINTSAECNTARHATLAEGTHISQDFTNATVNIVAGDQHTTVINEIHVADPHDSSEKELDQEKIGLEAEQGFLAKTMIHLRKEIRVDPKLVARPTMMVIDMKGTSAQVHGEDKTLFGRDLKEITFHQIHDSHNAKPTKHVTILGEAGAGKTTLSGIYSLAVAAGKVKKLDNIQLVHFVSAATLQSRSPTTAFRLFFMEQMAHDPDTKLSLGEQKAGAEWLENNSSKVLITIDGLDQCLKEFGNEKYPRVTATTPAEANDIIANIMAGRIWPDARVLTTSRWNTYWSIKDDEKPDKVVGLRGLDDKNMEEVVLSQSIDGIWMFIKLIANSPKLMNLCRNPMSLIYMMKIFQRNHNTLPDSLSGLMSAFFREFLSPSSAEYYDNITTLAYHSIRENNFVFPHSYLSRQGIDPKVLDDFLSTGAILEDGRDTVTSFDKSSEFSHQTMQEFCCALHVPNLTREEVKEFVTDQLNDSRMELTRQLLYGLMLDDKVTKPMRKYLANRTTSIQECREILIEQLDAKTKNGTIREIQTIKLLSECGDDTIKNIRQNVQRIVINDHLYLLQNDPILMASMIKRLSPLEEVFVNQFVLTPYTIEFGKLFFSAVDVFKIERLSIADRYLTQESLVEYLNIFRRCHSNVIALYNCHLTNENLVMIDQVCKNLKVQIPTLFITDIKMPDYAYRKLALTLKSIGCQNIWFVDCGLTKEKLSEFYSGCKDYDVSLSFLAIVDEAMTPDVYRDVATVVNITKCSAVFENCNLTKKKLRCFGTTCKENQISVSCLRISDTKIQAEGYREIAYTLKSIRGKQIQFYNCELTGTKLSEFYVGCKDSNISLRKLVISDETMTDDAYCAVPAIISITGCLSVNFTKCDMTKQKLKRFGTNAKKNKVSLQYLAIIDAKMPTDAYREIAVTLKSSDCKKILFEGCDLTREKLLEFYTGCKDNNISLSALSILDRTMTSDLYSNVATIVSITECSTVFFGNCDLTKQKLRCFGTTSKENLVSVSILTLADAKMSPDIYHEIPVTLDSIGCKNIQFEDCKLTSPKLSEFCTGCKENNLSLSAMAITDEKMASDVYCYVAVIIGVTSCSKVLFDCCDLTEQKLKCFRTTSLKKQVSISNLELIDAEMSSDTYREMALTVGTIGCKELLLKDCNLTKPKLFEFYNGCKDKKLYLSELSISDGTMASDVYSDVAAIISITRCSKLIFKNCNLTKQKLECFSTAVKENPVSISKLELTDAKMSSDTYREIPVSLMSMDCKEIRFIVCHLTKQKLTEFYNGCKDNNLSLLELLISDGSMASDVYRDVASIISITGCSRVFFGDCDLTNQKLRCFGTAGKEKRISLQTLQICDVKMAADGYRGVAATMKSIDCEKIRLDDCNLTIEKLSAFYTGCKENELSLSKLLILDRTMTSDAYSKVAAIICITRCSTVFFGNCDLTKEKLECFGKVVKKHQASLSVLEIEDAKMSADCYREFSTTLDSIGCKSIRLQNCNLTKQKLHAFYTGCRENKLSLSALVISDAAMACDVYCDVAAIISISGCSTVCFENCDLTRRKLRCFWRAGKENRLSLSILNIVDAKMTADDYREIAFTLKFIQCNEMQLLHCGLTRWKLSELQVGCQENDVSLRELTIFDSAMLPDAYIEVPAVAKAAKCTVVYFEDCELSKQKLECLGLGCKESKAAIKSLEIDWSHSTASEDLISALCDLMKFSVERLTLHKWIIGARWSQRLEDTLHLENSKAEYLQFPDTRMVLKHALMMKMFRETFNAMSPY